MTLRTITYNVLQCSGFWSRDAEERAARAFSADEAAERFASALAPFEADIVTLCESPAPAVSEAIAATLGLRCITFPSPRDWPGTLMTRLEVGQVAEQPPRRAKDVFTRHRGIARLRLDDGTELGLHSAHLHPNDDEVRAREQRDLLASIREDLEAGRSVLLQGDLNHRPDMPEYEGWAAAGLVDAAAGAGEEAHSFRADLPMARIDYVWAGGPLATRRVAARTLVEPPFTALTAEDPATPPLSDHLPVLAEFD
jgi:endonuclease/exonuclease/phosphatase (EEP) superfamily protein YafD